MVKCYQCLFTFFGVRDERDDEDDDDEDVRDEDVPEVGVVFRHDGSVATLARRRVHEALDGEEGGGRFGCNMLRASD